MSIPSHLLSTATTETAIERLSAHGPVLVLAPHPDDESLGCALLLDALWRRGGQAHVAAITDGGASHPRSRLWPPARLAETRRLELDRAVTILGGDPVRDVTWLGHPDGQSHCLHGPGADLARDIGMLVDRLGVGTLVSVAPEDRHADHRATARAAAQVRRDRPGLRLFHYPIWSRWSPVAGLAGPGPLALVRSSRRAVKRAAIDAHRSQNGAVVTDDPRGFCLPEGFAAFFATAPEIYREAPR